MQKDNQLLDLWSTEGAKLAGLIPKNYLVYAEIVGWVPGTETPIQADYTYQLPKGTCQTYIYRVAFVNEDGLVTDLTWNQIKEFCDQRGIKYVPELWRGKHKDLVTYGVENFLDTRLNDSYPQALKLDPDTVDEGICIRVDRLTPYILKAKGQMFYEHESKILDQGKADMESTGEDINPIQE